MRQTYDSIDYESVKQLFLKNEDKTYSGNFLKERYNISTIDLQGIIHYLRVKGYTIVSCGYLGYKYTNDKDDIMKCYMSLKKRGDSIHLAANSMYESYLDSQLKDDNGYHPI